MRRIGRAVLAVLSFGTCAAGLGAWAQTSGSSSDAAANAGQSSPPSSGVTLHVVSRETLVDVTVTDSKGNPVHGLTQDQFTVKEDGKVQAIRSFEEFGAAASPVPSHPKLPPNVYTNLQPPPASAAVNIFLIDLLNIAAMPGIDVLGAEDAYARSIAAQNAVKRDAKKYVASMPPGTQVIVLGLSNSLRVVQGLTSNPALLSAAIDTVEYNAEGRVSTYEQFCAQAELRTRMTLESLNQIAGDLSGIKGKKNVLWFSVGIPWLTDPSAHAQCLPDYSSNLLKTLDLFTAAQIAVYPIDARGVATMPSAFITSTGVLWANIPALPPPAYNKAQMDFFQTTAEQQLAMESIAEATGGYAYYNSNDLAGLIAKAVDKGENYYTLSYVPPGKKYDYGHHSIKVSVDQPGLHLVYRKSYDAVDPATIKPAPGLTLATSLPEGAPGDMRAAMSRSMPTSQQLLFDVQVEPSTEPARPGDPPVMGALDAKLQGKPLLRYGFEYVLAARQIAFAEGEDGRRNGSLEFDVAVYDGAGKLVTSLGQTIRLPLSGEQYRQLLKGPFRFFQQVDLPTGQMFVRVGVLDRTSNQVGSLEIPVMVVKK